MKVLFASGEALPFISTGGLGDVAGSLPRAIREKFVGCRVVIPLYSDIPESMRAQMKYITNFTVPVGWRNQYCGVFEAHKNGTIYYFLDNEYYFKRAGLYGHFDDGERYAFFSRAVLELIKHIDYKPDILHANDWQTALIPIYQKLLYADIAEYRDIKTVFTIHNILYQGQFGKGILSDMLGLSASDMPTLEFGGSINLMKAAIETADAVTTVSPTYANELKDPFFAHGLESIIEKNAYKLTGIINGIDTENYNPAKDETIYENYTAQTISAKAANKTGIQKLFGLPVNDTIPVIGMVTRLVDHKGLDLLRSIIDDLLKDNIQLIILGTGDKEFESFFTDISHRYPQKMAIKIGFIPDIAHKIYAGADIFLMPSKTEPCGLAQMVALRYGTIPIVRETGGLRDTVTDCGDGLGNGFSFAAYDAHDMIYTIRRAESAYANKNDWENLVQRALKCDFSWGNSAKSYIQLYKKLSAH